MKHTQLPPAPRGVKYALTVPQSVLFADLSLQGNRREFFRRVAGMGYEPDYIVVDTGGAMSWNYDSDSKFTESFLGGDSVTTSVARFINLMERTTRNLEKVSEIVSKPALRSKNTSDLVEDLEWYWDAYKLQMTSLFTFWNVENLISTTLIELLKKTRREEEIKNGLAKFFKPSETNYFVIERRQLQRIVRRFAPTGKIKKTSDASPELRAALEEHSQMFGFLIAPFNIGAPPSVEALIERVNETNTKVAERDEKMPLQDTLQDFPDEIRQIGALAQQFAFWKTERLDILSLADARVQQLYRAVAERIHLPLEQIFAMTASEILESVKAGSPVVDDATRAERQKAYCLLLHNGDVRFYAPSAPKANVEIANGDSSVLQGVVASPGKVKGKARVILSDKDLVDLKVGEILVASMTRPEFGPALDRAAAFVTDEGGMLSHAAIVSREMNKPCVIGTKVATQVLKTGDEIEVDATSGLVRILK